MCISPVTIDNPYYGKSPPLEAKYKRLYHNTATSRIRVPCGVCRECIANKQMQIVQRVQMEAINHHIFFVTLTYNNEMLPRVEFADKDGVLHSQPYADFHDLQNMFKLFRKYDTIGRPFKYLAVSEKGSQKGRPHFHLLVFVEKQDDDPQDIHNLQNHMYTVFKNGWCRNTGTNRKPVYTPCFTFAEKWVAGKHFCNFDCHYVRPFLGSQGADDVGFYVTKYVLKPNSKEQRLQQALKLNLDSDEYERIWKIVKPKRTASKDFGDSYNPDVAAYILNGLDSQIDKDYPRFYNPSNGQSFPLARFYRDRFLSLEHLDKIYKDSGRPEDNFLYQDPLNQNNVHQVELDLMDLQNIVFGAGDTLDIFE